MSKFSIKPQQIKALSEDERRIADQLGRYADELNSVKSELRSKIKSYSGIDQGLGRLSDNIIQHKNTVSSCQSALLSVIDNYERSENKVAGNAEATLNISNALSDLANQAAIAANAVIDGLTLHNIMNVIGDYDLEDIIKAIKNFKDLNPGEALTKWLEEQGIELASVPVISGIVSGLTDWTAVKDFLSDIPGSIKEEARNYIVDKTSFHEEIRGGDSLYSKEISGEYGSLSLDVGAYEYYADAEGHIFRVDDDGNMVFDPRIAAEIGASYTALNIAGNIGVGNEYLGANAEGEITVGRIAGNARAEAGLYDENGYFNPNASVNASLEAVAVEAKGEVGANIAGIEAKAKGSVYVGAGAHANIEVSGGKVSVDIGAAIGVGVSVGFEVDFSGVVNCVQDVCHSALDGLFGW